MPKINVYLPDDLAAAVRDAQVPVSAVCQNALERAVENDLATHADLVGRDAPFEEVGDLLDVLKIHEGERISSAVTFG